MKLSHVLPLAALSTAIVLPDEQVMSQIAIERPSKAASILQDVPCADDLVHGIKDTFSSALSSSKNAFDHAVEQASASVDNLAREFQATEAATAAWLDSAAASFDLEGGHGKHGKHGKGKHGRGKPNQTVYELIAESKYTTKLAGLINEYPDIVELLNGTTANYTIFAPIDKAFEKIPEGAPKPSKEFLKSVLSYHVSADFYPAGRVLVTHTVPMLYKSDALGSHPQRVSTNIGLRGLTVNFYSRVVAINIFGTNGVIHGVDSLLVPPPNSAEIITFLPGDFSTLELGLLKTGLLEVFNDTTTHTGSTLFAPSNFAFQKLGPRINGFLFSSYGQKYLKALLKYHAVANQTLYSDAYYKAEDADQANIPKGLFHVDLPTLLKERSLSIDVARYGRYINIKINGFTSVSVEDGISADGVIHVVPNVLIPPKQVGGVLTQWEGEELEVEDLKQRLESLVEDDGSLDL